jgi:hypothetical protein
VGSTASVAPVADNCPVLVAPRDLRTGEVFKLGVIEYVAGGAARAGQVLCFDASDGKLHVMRPAADEGRRRKPPKGNRPATQRLGTR